MRAVLLDNLRQPCKLPTSQRGDLRASLAALERCLALSANIADESPVDVLGAIADAHADLGDLERAGEVSSATSVDEGFVCQGFCECFTCPGRPFERIYLIVAKACSAHSASMPARCCWHCFSNVSAFW